jgi:SHS2 domain-containing protein
LTVASASAGEWSHFQHGADVGVRGKGPTKAAAFEQAACALFAVVTPLDRIAPITAVKIACEAPNDGLLLVDWLNALIFRMAVDRMLFSRFEVTLDGTRLAGQAWGESVDPARHEPAVEPKGATYTALSVKQQDGGDWVAECVVDV